jgi:hypothetical protein
MQSYTKIPSKLLLLIHMVVIARFGILVHSNIDIVLLRFLNATNTATAPGLSRINRTLVIVEIICAAMFWMCVPIAFFAAEELRPSLLLPPFLPESEETVWLIGFHVALLFNWVSKRMCIARLRRQRREN